MNLKEIGFSCRTATQKTFRKLPILETTLYTYFSPTHPKKKQTCEDREKTLRNWKDFKVFSRSKNSRRQVEYEFEIDDFPYTYYIFRPPIIEKVLLLFVFYGPVQTHSVDLFTILCKEDIVHLYLTFQKFYNLCIYKLSISMSLSSKISW